MVELVKSFQAVPGGMLNVLLSTIAGNLPKAIYMEVQLIFQLLEMMEPEMWKSWILLDGCPCFDRRQLASGEIEYLVREAIQAGQAWFRQCWQVVQLP
jgi:hypothetical protein